MVGDAAVDFDPAVHRAGVHDDRIGLGFFEAFRGQAVERVIFARAGQIGTVHALVLEAQHHHDVGVLQAFVHVGEGRHMHPVDCGRSERRGGDHAHLVAEQGEGEDIRARDAAVQHVAADRDGEAFDAAQAAADGERVEQRLRRMLVAPVTRVKHRAVDLVGDQLDRPRAAMPDHHRVGAHRVQRHRGVDQRFALFDARLRGVHIDDVCPEAFSRDLERQERTRRIFEKGVDDGEPGEAVVMLGGTAAIQIDPLFGSVENIADLPRGQLGDADQVAMAKGIAAGRIVAGGSDC